LFDAALQELLEDIILWNNFTFYRSWRSQTCVD